MANQKDPQLDISRLKYENENIKTVLNQIITEYADYRIECDEICKEYEETIQLLTDSLEKYKLEITKLNNENEKMKNDQEKITKELEKSRQKNRDKIKDIEVLNNKIDQLQSQFKSINKKETTLKSKVVTLETDNDHYLNKIHQYEEEVTDLKNNLENTIENLITTQNEYEEFKSKKEEEVERLKLKLQEEKGTIRALMKHKPVIKHSRMKSSINFKLNEDNDDNIEDNNETAKRKLSWSEESNLRAKMDKNDTNKENINGVSKKKQEEYANELDLMLDYGYERGRNGRSLTLQKVKYNFGDIVSKMRKRREELAKLNQKIKNDNAKYIKN